MKNCGGRLLFLFYSTSCKEIGICASLIATLIANLVVLKTVTIVNISFLYL